MVVMHGILVGQGGVYYDVTTGFGSDVMLFVPAKD